MKRLEQHLANNIIRYSVFLAVLLVTTAHVAEAAYQMGWDQRTAYTCRY
jgi:hypothetical protein